jgi:hypothetical protein
MKEWGNPLFSSLARPNAEYYTTVFRLMQALDAKQNPEKTFQQNTAFPFRTYLHMEW